MTPRHRFGVDARLLRRDISPLPCRSRDVSRDGMFVVLDRRAPELAPGDPVTVELPCSHGPRCVLAVVVHVSDDGAGLMLATPDMVAWPRATRAASAAA